jgi:transposase InsO family protein
MQQAGRNHADRGSQYTRPTYQELLAKSGIAVTMSN